MKRTAVGILVAVLAAVMMTMTGCRRYEQIRIVSGELESVNMNGFRSADIHLVVKVDNPAGKVVVKKGEGVLKHSGKILGSVSLAPVTLRPRTVSDYPVQAHVELEPGVGLKEIMRLASPTGLGECTIDVYVSGTVAGVAVKRQINDIPLKRLLESKIYEKI